MDLFFNELSLCTATDRYETNGWFEALGRLCKAASTKGVGEIKVPNVFFGHAFMDAYTFYQWVNDLEFDQDLRSLLKSKITTTPTVEGMLEEKEAETSRSFECRCGAQLAIGLGAASSYRYDSLSVSLQADRSWDQPLVSVNILLLDEHGVLEESCEVRHLFRAAHLETHAEWLTMLQRRQVPNGQVLWLKRGELFPNLVFCEHVKGQIAHFSGKQPEFIQLQKRLFELEDYAARRSAGEFDADALPSKVTPESETRLRDFAAELTRACPDGEIRLFSWHARFTPGAWRLHFYPLEKSNEIIVGNVANQNEIK